MIQKKSKKAQRTKSQKRILVIVIVKKMENRSKTRRKVMILTISCLKRELNLHLKNLKSKRLKNWPQRLAEIQLLKQNLKIKRRMMRKKILMLILLL